LTSTHPEERSDVVEDAVEQAGDGALRAQARASEAIVAATAAIKLGQ
jgi:hypothetical protein